MAVDSTIANNKGVDVSYPRLFRLVNKNYIFANPTPEFELSTYMGLCRKRRDDIDKKMQVEYRNPEGDVNIDYWNSFCRELIKDDYSVDWENAKTYGQLKWKDII